ncbi:MAG: helix-hairpin-helix domain-containing protein [bacterium]
MRRCPQDRIIMRFFSRKKFYILILLLFTLHSSLFTNTAFCAISDADLENVYDEVMEDIEVDKIGYEELDTDELEDFRRNPLDINTAAREDLLKLPMLTPVLAVEIVRYRVRRGEFREVAELMDIPGMTDEIYRVIIPFLTVFRKKEIEMVKGDLRLTQSYDTPFKDKQAEANANFHHPEYLYSRLRFFYSDDMEISFTAKRDAWGREITWENFKKYYLVSNYFYAKNFIGFDTFVVGSFKMDFERGLVLGGVAKTISAVSKPKKGVEPYRSSNKNAGYYGLAVQKNDASCSWAAFFSDKWLTTKLNPDGTVKSYPTSVSFSYTNQDKFKNLNNMHDRSYGGYFAFPVDTYEIHFAGYHEEISPEIIPVVRTLEEWWTEEEEEAALEEWDETKIKYIKYKFSGSRNDILGGGVKTTYGNGLFTFDYALSIHDAYESDIDKTKEREKAKAFQFASVYNFSYTTLLFGLSRFDSDYYNFHISGDAPNEKFFMEAKTKTKRLSMKLNGEIYREVNPIKELTTKRFYKTAFQVEYPLMPKLKTLFRYQIQNEDDKIKDYEGTEYFQIYKETNQTRAQITWSPTSDLRLQWRYELQQQIYNRISGDEYNIWLYSASQVELKYRFTKYFQVLSKIRFDKDPGARRNRYTSFSLNPKMKFSKNSSIDIKYDRKMYHYPPEFYDPNYGALDYDDDVYKYDPEDVMSDSAENFEIRYMLKF